MIKINIFSVKKMEFLSISVVFSFFFEVELHGGVTCKSGTVYFRI